MFQNAPLNDDPRARPEAAHADRLPPPGSAGGPPLRRPGLWLALLVAYAAALYFPFLGSAPLISHEGRLALRTQEMMAAGEWVVPHMNGERDLQKPPLPFWIAGGLSKLTGAVDEWTVRVPSVLATGATMLVVVLWVRRARNWRAALLAGFVYATCIGSLWRGRRAEPDSQLTLFAAATMFAYSAGLWARPWARRALWFALAWGAMGAGTMVKGPFMLPPFVITAAGMMLFSREARRPGTILCLAATAPLMLAVALPWYLYVALRYEEAWSVWWAHSVGRYGGELGERGGVFYYFTHLPALLLPWVVAMGIGVWAAWRRGRLALPDRALLLLWIGGTMAYLTPAASRYSHYVLPTFPAAAALGGVGLEYLLYALPRRLTGAARAGFRLHLLLVPAAVPLTVAGVLMAPPFAGAIVALGAVAMVGLAAVFYLYQVGRRGASLLVLAAALLGVQWVGEGLLIVPLRTRYYAMPAAGRVLNERRAWRDGVAQFSHVYGSLVYYAGRPVEVCESVGQIRAWRQRHPNGVLFTTRDQYILLPTSLGDWRPIPFLPADELMPEERYVLLRATGPPPPRATTGLQLPAGRE